MLDQKYSEFPHIQHPHMEVMLTCMSICSACERMCIEEGHKETAKLCGDCADICALAVKLHSKDSEFNIQIMQLCSEACGRCAQACAKMQTGHCQQCSDICKKCASACKK